MGKNAECNQSNNDRDTDIDQRLESRGETSRNVSVVAKDHVLLQATRFDAARARASSASRANTLCAVSHLLATSGQNTCTAARRNTAHGGWADNGHIILALAVALWTRKRIVELLS